ncbi:MAG: hypothetical protein QOH13_1886 [Thermoleophilaceae bacterium]|nr:hypothetical protein [Thermoleophilaceae bacterium]
MRTVSVVADVDLPPQPALRLWTDTSRWPTFVDGFSRVVQIDANWPEPGSKVVWESGAAGRGRVTERVIELTDTTFETQVFEQQLSGRQMLQFDVGEVVMELEYELQKGGPLRGLTDALFIRRALSDMLARTLRRFSTEAAEEAAL